MFNISWYEVDLYVLSANYTHTHTDTHNGVCIHVLYIISNATYIIYNHVLYMLYIITHHSMTNIKYICVYGQVKSETHP